MRKTLLRRERKHLEINRIKTLKVNKGTVKIFIDYLKVIGEDENFEELTVKHCKLGRDLRPLLH